MLGRRRCPSVALPLSLCRSLSLSVSVFLSLSLSFSLSLSRSLSHTHTLSLSFSASSLDAAPCERGEERGAAREAVFGFSFSMRTAVFLFVQMAFYSRNCLSIRAPVVLFVQPSFYSYTDAVSARCEEGAFALASTLSQVREARSKGPPATPGSTLSLKSRATVPGGNQKMSGCLQKLSASESCQDGRRTCSVSNFSPQVPTILGSRVYGLRFTVHG